MKNGRNIDRAVDGIVLHLERDFASLRNRNEHAFRVTLNEAQALAWESEWPHLILPELAQEKLWKMEAWQQRQLHVRAASQPILAIVA